MKESMNKNTIEQYIEEAKRIYAIVFINGCPSWSKITKKAAKILLEEAKTNHDNLYGDIDKGTLLLNRD